MQAALAEEIRDMSDIDFARFLYCQHMSATFMSVNRLEHLIVRAMLMCDRIQTRKILGKDLQTWEQMLEKQENLQRSTLGSLIRVLETNAIDAVDISYLKWIKDKRDYFIHRLFHEGAWPGDMNIDDCRIMTRRLLAIQIWLSRAESRIWYIFRKAGLVHIDNLGRNGLLVANVNLLDL